MDSLSVKTYSDCVSSFLEWYGKGLYQLMRKSSNGSSHGQVIKKLSDLDGKGPDPDFPEALRHFQLLFLSEKPGMEQVAELDRLMDAFPYVALARDYLTDMLLLKLILDGTNRFGEDYLDSPQWEEIEDATLEFGSELLTLMIYLRDCNENEQAPDLDDFLVDFLLDSDEPYQDEYFIYEPFIKNQENLEASVSDLIQIKQSIKQEEIIDLFLPFMLFFKSPEIQFDAWAVSLLNESDSPALEAALYIFLHKFRQTVN